MQSMTYVVPSCSEVYRGARAALRWYSFWRAFAVPFTIMPVGRVRECVCHNAARRLRYAGWFSEVGVGALLRDPAV
jgi:hypothetical protein